MKYIQFFMLSAMLFLTFHASGQGFKKGRVYLMNGDTLTGYISDGNYETLSHSIHFKSNKKEGEFATYLPNEIRGFEYSGGDYFISELVQFSSFNKHHNIENTSEIRFLHRIYNNKKTSLYELNDRRSSPLYLQKGDGPLRLLCLDINGNPAYLEELALTVKDCESAIVPANLPLDARAIQAVLSSYDNCGQSASPTPIPQAMVWGGVSLPFWAYMDGHKGLGKSFQIEFRPTAQGFFSNVSVGAEFLHLDAFSISKEDWGRNVSSIKHRELSIKASLFLNAMKGRLRPYGFLQWATTATSYERFSQYSGDSNPKWNVSKWAFDGRGIRPGLGLHGQWRRHFIRVEMPIDDDLQPRIGYGYAF